MTSALTGLCLANSPDIDNSGLVDVEDILLAVHDFGPCGDSDCPADLDEDGEVTIYDLLEIIAHYGHTGTMLAGDLADTSLLGTRLVIQNAMADEQESLNELGIANDAWILSGSALDARKNMSLSEFLEASEATVIARFIPYLQNHPDLTVDTTQDVILDIEHPVHPRDLGRYLDETDPLYDPSLYEEIVDAFKLRISVARSVLPNARLGLYGVTTPHPSGEATMGTEVIRMLGYQAASDAGLYDDIDFLATVLYARFGQSDHYHSRIESYTQLGIHHTTLLHRSDGSSLATLPLLSLTIFNGSSPHHGEPVPLVDLALQINTLKDMGVAQWMFWNGSNVVSGTEEPLTQRFSDLLLSIDSIANGNMDGDM